MIWWKNAFLRDVPWILWSWFLQSSSCNLHWGRLAWHALRLCPVKTPAAKVVSDCLSSWMVRWGGTPTTERWSSKFCMPIYANDVNECHYESKLKNRVQSRCSCMVWQRMTKMPRLMSREEEVTQLLFIAFPSVILLLCWAFSRGILFLLHVSCTIWSDFRRDMFRYDPRCNMPSSWQTASGMLKLIVYYKLRMVNGAAFATLTEASLPKHLIILDHFLTCDA